MTTEIITKSRNQREGQYAGWRRSLQSKRHERTGNQETYGEDGSGLFSLKEERKQRRGQP